MNAIVKNVEYIIEKYGSKLESGNHLLILYWKLFDKIEISKESISTQQFIKSATSPADIISSRYLLESIEKE